MHPTRPSSSSLLAATATTLLVLAVPAAGTAAAQPAAAGAAQAVSPATAGARLGARSWPFPAGAYVVSPTGSDTAAGTLAAPWRTVAYAVRKAPAGATVVLRGGTYHESVQTVKGKRLVLQPYLDEVVWFDGSVPVSGWVQDGTAWRKDGWTATFDRTDPTANAAPGFRMVDPDHPLAGWADMVFLDGEPLQQVASRDAVVPGTFFVDYATSRLWVGSSPDGHAVDASDLAEALYVNGSDGSVVQGIGFRRYATPMARMGAVKGFANSLTFDGDVFADNALAGLALNGSGITVRDSTSCDNGQIGITANTSDGATVTGDLLCRNNAEHFSQIPAAGGVKFTASRQVTVMRDVLQDNDGTGVWFDRSSLDVSVLRNLATGNSRHGVLVEISARALVAGNVAADNGGSGIRVIESNDVGVWDNTLVRNGRAFDALEGAREATDGPQGHDPRYPDDMTASFDLRRVVVRNNVLWGGAATTTMLLNVDDGTRQTPASSMVSADSDAFYRPAANAPTRLAAWDNWPTAMVSSNRLTDLQSATGQEAHGTAVDAPVDPYFTNAAAGDYTVLPTGPAASGGAPLPADVAAALELPPTWAARGAPTG